MTMVPVGNTKKKTRRACFKLTTRVVLKAHDLPIKLVFSSNSPRSRASGLYRRPFIVIYVEVVFSLFSFYTAGGRLTGTGMLPTGLMTCRHGTSPPQASHNKNCPSCTCSCAVGGRETVGQTPAYLLSGIVTIGAYRVHAAAHTRRMMLNLSHSTQPAVAGCSNRYLP